MAQKRDHACNRIGCLSPSFAVSRHRRLVANKNEARAATFAYIFMAETVLCRLRETAKKMLFDAYRTANDAHHVWSTVKLKRPPLTL